MKQTKKPSRRCGQTRLPTLGTHVLNITVPIVYALIFATPMLGLVAAVEPVI